MKDADSFKWTPDGIETLRAHALAGLTAKAAGERMGISRCAALGKAMRIGLKFTGNPPPPPRVPVKPKKLVLAPVVVLPPAPPPVPSEGFSLMDLPTRGCKWPLEWSGPEIMMCGAGRGDDKTYCQFHRKKASQPAATTGNQLQRSLRRYTS